jgi:sulfur-oxidizing protein SoxY
MKPVAHQKQAMPSRRHALKAGAAVAASATAANWLISARALASEPALPWPAATQAAINAFTGGAPLQQGSLLKLLIEPLVENGNGVPVTLLATPPAGAAAVRRLALFAESNPEPGVAVFELGPASVRAEVSTRIRLFTTQRVLGVAQLADGQCWSQAIEVVVTLAACVES